MCACAAAARTQDLGPNEGCSERRPVAREHNVVLKAWGQQGGGKETDTTNSLQHLWGITGGARGPQGGGGGGGRGMGKVDGGGEGDGDCRFASGHHSARGGRAPLPPLHNGPACKPATPTCPMDIHECIYLKRGRGVCRGACACGGLGST